MRPLHALLAIGATVAALPPSGTCRCLPSAPCWDAVPFAALNASVWGRLLALEEDELAPCLTNVTSPACSADLNATDNEFWLSSQPWGYLHTGQFRVWNISGCYPSYAVAARSEADIQAAVAFALAHNLRLVVKGTGHDWYARSAGQGALMIWTHLMGDITFGTYGGIPSVTVQAGVQFDSLYAQNEAAGRLTIGGTCDSVGVGGCFQGGCFGTFSRLYGSAASNLLEARVVLANGSLIVANATSHADLFWAVRGGAAGLGGVVTQFTARTHAPPRWFIQTSLTFTTDNLTLFSELLQHVMVHTRTLVLNASWCGYVGFNRARVGGGYSVSVGDKAFEGDEAVGNAMLQPLLAWVATQPAVSQYPTQVTWSLWNASTAQPGAPLPWMELHPDREISTALTGSLSRYPLLSMLDTPEGIALTAQAFANLTDMMPDLPGFPFGIDIEKGQAAASPFALQLLNETSQNAPVLSNAIGLFLVMVNIPSLPQLPPSSALLASQWPRLQQYLFNSANTGNGLWQICNSGAAGNESAAVECYSTIETVTIPSIQASIAAMNETMLRVWPNVDSNGAVFSGSYWNEADFHDGDWQAAHWGANYDRLLAVKQAYDPDGLFVCHHCVGSEFWSADGNCVL